MAEAEINQADVSGSHIKIGKEHHPGRNLMLAIGAIVAIGGMGGFYWYSSSKDAPKLVALAEFRAAYAKKCDAADFTGETPQYVADAYINSSAMQDVVSAQRAAMDHTSCEDIQKALKAASFPLAQKR